VPAGSVPAVLPRAVGKNPAQAQRIEETRAKLKRRVETQERRERLKQKATSLEEVQAELAAEDAASAGKYSETSLERERRRERKLRRERLDQKKQQVQKVLKSAQN
jgi:hypothetical protein